jgi:hypothetical protein
MSGPILPGMREFDRPRGRGPAWVVWAVMTLVVLAVVIVLAGFVGGVGPLRVLGQSTVPLEPVAYRVTDDDALIEIAVTLPPDGLCRDDVIDAVAFERSNRVEVEASVTRGRAESCTVTTIGGDVRWADVRLDSPLGTRTVIRATDREPLTREAAGIR